jgi:hypothetical protein
MNGELRTNPKPVLARIYRLLSALIRAIRGQNIGSNFAGFGFRFFLSCYARILSAKIPSLRFASFAVERPLEIFTQRRKARKESDEHQQSLLWRGVIA